MRTRVLVAPFVAALLTVSACSGEAEPAPTVTVTVTATVTASPTPTSTSTVRRAPSRYPSGDPVLPGYPVLVTTAKLDSRVANAIQTPQAVALAPGVYAGYNPAVTNLAKYLNGPSDGDCAVRELYFPNSGGACWTGVLPGPEEPAQ